VVIRNTPEPMSSNTNALISALTVELDHACGGVDCALLPLLGCQRGITFARTNPVRIARLGKLCCSVEAQVIS
jgi:hypothetical protein